MSVVHHSDYSSPRRFRGNVARETVGLVAGGEDNGRTENLQEGTCMQLKTAPQHRVRITVGSRGAPDFGRD